MDCIKCKKGIPEDALFCPYCGKKQIQEKKKRKRANGQGSVSKRPDLKTKPWRARKNGVFVGYYATRYEAERAIMEIGDRRALNTINATFAQVYARWLPEHSRDRFHFIYDFRGLCGVQSRHAGHSNGFPAWQMGHQLPVQIRRHAVDGPLDCYHRIPSVPLNGGAAIAAPPGDA